MIIIVFVLGGYRSNQISTRKKGAGPAVQEEATLTGIGNRLCRPVVGSRGGGSGRATNRGQPLRSCCLPLIICVYVYLYLSPSPCPSLSLSLYIYIYCLCTYSFVYMYTVYL